MRFSILLPSAEGKQPGGNPLAPDMFDYRASNAHAETRMFRYQDRHTRTSRAISLNLFAVTVMNPSFSLSKPQKNEFLRLIARR